MKTRKTKQGFTLIELLIVIAIIGLLATLAIVSLTSAQQKARDAKRIADVKQLQNAVELYFSTNSTYPDASGFTTWTAFGTSIADYITNIPVDPTNSGSKTYVYGSEDAVSSVVAEYFVGAQLEANNVSAINGDDDVNYTSALSGWTGIDPVWSVDTSSEVGGASMNCSTETGSTYNYCTSE